MRSWESTQQGRNHREQWLEFMLTIPQEGETKVGKIRTTLKIIRNYTKDKKHKKSKGKHRKSSETKGNIGNHKQASETIAKHGKSKESMEMIRDIRKGREIMRKHITRMESPRILARIHIVHTPGRQNQGWKASNNFEKHRKLFKSWKNIEKHRKAKEIIENHQKSQDVIRKHRGYRKA